MKKYELRCNIVMLSHETLDMSEWHVLTPHIAGANPNVPLNRKRATVNLRVRRLSRYYLFNVVLMMWFISKLGLTAFVMDVDDLGSRVTTCITLLLTSVAFKFVLSSSLPKVPYNTLLDLYIWIATFSLVLMSVLCIVPSFFPHEDGTPYTAHLAKGVRGARGFFESADAAARVNVVMGMLSLAFNSGGLILWYTYAGWMVSRSSWEEDVLTALRKAARRDDEKKYNQAASGAGPRKKRCVRRDRDLVGSDGWCAFRFADAPFLNDPALFNESSEDTGRKYTLLQPGYEQYKARKRRDEWQHAGKLVKEQLVAGSATDRRHHAQAEMQPREAAPAQSDHRRTQAWSVHPADHGPSS